MQCLYILHLLRHFFSMRLILLLSKSNNRYRNVTLTGYCSIRFFWIVNPIQIQFSKWIDNQNPITIQPFLEKDIGQQILNGQVTMEFPITIQYTKLDCNPAIPWTFIILHCRLSNVACVKKPTKCNEHFPILRECNFPNK